MNKEDRALAIEIAFIAVFFSMGIGSMLNADSIKLHLDIFAWSQNKTALSSEIQQEIDKKRDWLYTEIIFGIVFIGLGLIWLVKLALKYKKKTENR